MSGNGFHVTYGGDTRYEKEDNGNVDTSTLQEIETHSIQENQFTDIETEVMMEEESSKEIETDVITGVEKESSYDQSTTQGEREDSVIHAEESAIEGYTYVDGREVPIKVEFEIQNILKGEDAYVQLHELNQEVEQPDENEEYIIVIFNVFYVDGEAEELFLFENRASLREAALYFSLANSSSNACDMTSYLSDSIYNISILKGQNTQGSVAFLQEKGNTEPLSFVGFGKVIEFNINEL